MTVPTRLPEKNRLTFRCGPNLSSIAFTDIATLVTNTDGEGKLGVLRQATVIVEDGRIAWVGDRKSAPTGTQERVSCAERTVVPGFVDSHAHLAFVGDRSSEFAARMAGLPYGASGIQATVAATNAASAEELRAALTLRVHEMHSHGVTTFESKSGYSLTTEGEAKLLALTGEFTPETTFLGAHVVPKGMQQDSYVELVVGAMLDRCAPHARWIDVFCDQGAFTTDQARQILTAGMHKGLGGRLHAAQLASSDAVEMAVELGVASVDHCNYLTRADVAALASSDTVATLLPAADFSTRAPYAPARDLIDAGATIAIATNCNPGSSFTTSMAFCVAIAVRDMKLTVEEALWAATAGGARALRREELGHISVGAPANMVLLESPSYLHLAYRPGMNLIDAVYKDGALMYERSHS